MLASGVATAVLLLPGAAPGAVEDRTPSMLTPRLATDALLPTFVWSPATDTPDPLDHYELVIDGGNPIPIPATQVSYIAEGALFPGVHSWIVTAVESDGDRLAQPAPQLFMVDPTIPPAPAVDGPIGLTNDDTPTFSWDAPGIMQPTFLWQVIRTGSGEEIVASSPGGGVSGSSTTIPGLDDGTYAFSITVTRPFGQGGGVSGNAVLGFTVDTSPPAAALVVGRPAPISTDTKPTFTWTGEPGARYVWRLLGPGGSVVQGPTSTTATSVQLQVVPGAYFFDVTQIDLAGNTGPASAPEPFTVQEPPPPPPPTVTTTPTTPTEPTNTTPDTGSKDKPPATRNAGALTPRAGSEFTALRPTLRWPTRKGADLYNVQVFALKGEKLTKVVSAFPRNNFFKLPPNRLKAGSRYIWRIWPYIDGSYPGQPLGISYFDVKASAPSSSPARQQMLTAQRIAQSAVRRLNGVQEWLDQGLVAGDIIGGGIGGVDLSPAIVTAPVTPPHAVEEAAPRKVVVAAAGGGGDGSKIRVSAKQLRINQRIAAAAVRRANAIEARLERGLTGGDLRGAVITLGKLEPGLQVLSMLPGVAPPASQTILAPLGQQNGRVRVNRKQLRINLRISQAAARRAQELIERLESGLSGADFQDASIAPANLVNPLR
ncbi:MAG: large repetitive protein [Miltoncostaeaceae bacterium]|nr:large repetitive protein [Miltoncostaeaceae bacterium]